MRVLKSKKPSRIRSGYYEAAYEVVAFVTIDIFPSFNVG